MAPFVWIFDLQCYTSLKGKKTLCHFPTRHNIISTTSILGHSQWEHFSGRVNFLSVPHTILVSLNSVHSKLMSTPLLHNPLKDSFVYFIETMCRNNISEAPFKGQGHSSGSQIWAIEFLSAQYLINPLQNNYETLVRVLNLNGAKCRILEFLVLLIDYINLGLLFCALFVLKNIDQKM